MKYRHFPLPVHSTLLASVLLLQVTAQTPPNQAPQAPPVVPKTAPPVKAAPPVTPAAPPVAQEIAPAEPIVPAPQRVVATPPPTKRDETLKSFKFEQSSLDVVMPMYCEWTGKLYLKTDPVKANITLQADKLTTQESIQVVEAILGMNNIALVPMGDKFIKVVMATDPALTGHGGEIIYDQEKEFAGTDSLVTQIIHLENTGISEVQTAVQQLMNAYGKILALESSNSLMITDTEANILRIREMIDFLDQATARIEPRIYQIEFAEATEIASKLNEIVTMAQADQPKAAAPVGNYAARTPPGVIRSRQAAPTAPTRASISTTGESPKLIIQGSVKVMADERTNIILIFSQEENFDFFDKIIKVLDIEVEPAISFEVVNLEYADAEELSGTLNELVGAAQSSQSSSGSTSPRSPATSQPTPRTTRQISPQATAGALQSLARLSENTKILADQRSNSILLMGRKSDIVSIKNVIASLDVMLEQVVIEAAIFEIGLDDNLRHGIDWIYGQEGDDRIGAWDGQSILTNSLENVVSGALSYYMNVPGIDSKFLINVSKTDANARLVSTPVIMTTDNTEATLSIGEQRPVVTSTSSYANSSGTQSSQYEYKDIGIQLTVTPRINPQRFVIMELSQKADSLGGNVLIDGNEVPIIKNREFDASIAVPDGGTVVLGGLISTETTDSLNKIPILGDIPLLGRYLFSSVTKVDAQRELIVLMTPYVMTDQKEMIEQSERLYQGTTLKQEDWKGNWSESKLRHIPDPVDIEDEKREEK